MLAEDHHLNLAVTSRADHNCLFRSTQRRGVVMVLAIIVLILSSSISLSMIRTTSLRQQRFENNQRKLQATLLADSAIDRVKQKLIEDSNYAGEVWKIEANAEAGEAAIRVKENLPRRYAVEIVAVYPLELPHRTQVSIETTITLPALTASTTR